LLEQTVSSSTGGLIVTVVVPQTTLDLESILCDKLDLKPKEVERYFDFDEKDGKLVIAQHKDSRGKTVWLDRSIWVAVNNYVQELGGAWVPQERLWEIPKSIPSSRPADTPKPIPKVIPSPTLESRRAIEPAYYPQFDVDKIISPTIQLRVDLHEDLEEMMQQIHAAGRILEPLIARPHPRKHGFIELAAGQRRLSAAQKIGLKTVPMLVFDLSDEEFDKTRLIENIARKDLTDYELGKAFQKLQTKYKYSEEQIAQLISKSLQFVSDKIICYRTIEQAKSNILHGVEHVENPVEAHKKLEQLTSTQTRVIRKAPTAKQPELIKETIEQDLSPKELESRVKLPEIPKHPPTDPTEEAKIDPPEQRETEIPESKPKPQEIDVANFLCTECNEKYLLVHVAPGNHRLERVGKN
jgi:ParB/RepB/Spo0J family partition protein